MNKFTNESNLDLNSVSSPFKALQKEKAFQ